METAVTTVLMDQRAAHPATLPVRRRAALRALLATIKAYDAYTGGHSERVANYGGTIAEQLALDPGEVDVIRKAGYVHDIGKICLPEWLLNKPGPLNKDEVNLFKRHPVMGANILSGRRGMDAVVPAVLHHHERWDGAGYPAGLSGEAIPLAARIVFVADAYDAMTSNRPYGRVLNPHEAMKELERCGGAEFDPTVVSALVMAEAAGSLGHETGGIEKLLA
jgi:putative nucleotidyltransferase with HDIG domain